MDVRATTEAPQGRGRTRSQSVSSRTRGSRTTRRTARSARSSTRARPSPASASSPSPTPSGQRWLVAGLGKRDDFDPERARVVAGGVIARARELGARSLCWEPPPRLRRPRRGVRRGQRDGRLRVHDVQERRRRGRQAELGRADRLRPPRRRRRGRDRPRRRRVGQPRPRPPEPPRQRPRRRQRTEPSGRARSPTATTRSRSRSWAARRSRRPGWARSPASRRAPTRSRS